MQALTCQFAFGMMGKSLLGCGDAIAKLEQREMLLEIIKNQMIEARREEIATDAKEAIAAFHRGELKSQSLENIIVELQASLTED